ncbi:MAG TPA: protein YgfX, partial [Telluria sp.]
VRLRRNERHAGLRQSLSIRFAKKPAFAAGFFYRYRPLPVIPAHAGMTVPELSLHVVVQSRSARSAPIPGHHMSIACTVHIGASRTMRAALAAFAALHVALASGIASAWLGEFHLPTFLPAVHIAAAIACAVCAAQRTTARQIDVSGVGAITVTVKRYVRHPSGPPPEHLRLLPGSTFLPGLLVLRLVDQQGKHKVIAVLPDAMRGGEFRRFAAALRTIAARDEGFCDRTFELIAGGQAQRL